MLEFKPGILNKGADLLSRKGKKVQALGSSALLIDDQEKWTLGEEEHFVREGLVQTFQCSATDVILPRDE